MEIRKIFLALAFIMANTFTMAQKIGLLMDSYFIDRWYTDQKFIAERIKELGGECVIEVANGEPDEQLRLGKKMIADGVKVLIIVPTDAKKAALIVDAAKAANVAVIAYDRLIDSKDLTFYISYNNFKVGVMQASYAIQKKPTGNYLLINGPVSDNNAILFREGQLSVLKPAIDTQKIKLIGDMVLDGWSELECMMKTADLLSSAKTNPDVIIAANDALASGAQQSLSANLQGKVVITGQDADMTGIKNIISGNQSMTIYKPIKPLAFQAAESAMKLAHGEKLEHTFKMKTSAGEVNAILLEPVLVDKTNYKETVIKDGHVKLPD